MQQYKYTNSLKNNGFGPKILYEYNKITNKYNIKLIKYNYF